MSVDAACSPEWVRLLLNQCRFLESVKSVDCYDSTVIKFAIRWAPFGGADACDLMVTFGVNRWRFIQMLRESLRPRGGDRRDVRTLKRNLLDTLAWSWQAHPDSSAAHLGR